jgi:purine-binding chemotaxis protein CheW
MPPLLEGFLNLGGTAVPVLRLDRLFHLTEVSSGLYSMLLIIRAGDHLRGLLVDNVSDIIFVSEKDLLPIREKQAFNDCAQAEVAVNGCLVHLLDAERILLEQERNSLAEFQIMAQSRLRELEAAR